MNIKSLDKIYLENFQFLELENHELNIEIQNLNAYNQSLKSGIKALKFENKELKAQINLPCYTGKIVHEINLMAQHYLGGLSSNKIYLYISIYITFLFGEYCYAD